MTQITVEERLARFPSHHHYRRLGHSKWDKTCTGCSVEIRAFGPPLRWAPRDKGVAPNHSVLCVPCWEKLQALQRAVPPGDLGEDLPPTFEALRDKALAAAAKLLPPEDEPEDEEEETETMPMVDDPPANPPQGTDKILTEVAVKPRAKPQALVDLLSLIERLAKVEAMASGFQTKVLEIRQPDKIEKIENSHAALEELLVLVQAGFQNLYMVGPAGCGKSRLAEDLAKGLGRPFGFLSLSGGTNETHLVGRTLPQADGSWAYVRSSFVEIYEGGGVFLLDEMDGADPNVLVAVNAALANGQLANPMAGKIHSRHPDTIILCAANTYGTGATAQYIGRNALDAATLDRFVGAMVEVGYDPMLEQRIVNSHLGAKQDGRALLHWVERSRASIAASKLRRVLSTRAVEAGARLLRSGLSLEMVRQKLLTGWSVDEMAKVPL